MSQNLRLKLEAWQVQFEKSCLNMDTAICLSWLGLLGALQGGLD